MVHFLMCLLCGHTRLNAKDLVAAGYSDAFNKVTNMNDGVTDGAHIERGKHKTDVAVLIIHNL